MNGIFKIQVLCIHLSYYYCKDSIHMATYVKKEYK